MLQGENLERGGSVQRPGSQEGGCYIAEETGSGEGQRATKRATGSHTELAACQRLSPAVISGCLAPGRSPESHALIQGLRQ